MWALQKLRTLISAKSDTSLNVNALLTNPSPDTPDADTAQKTFVSIAVDSYITPLLVKGRGQGSLWLPCLSVLLRRSLVMKFSFSGFL